MTNTQKSFYITILAGVGVMLLTFGPRSSLGLFMEPLSSTNQWTREVFAFAIAIQNLVWGLTQPFFGAVADRFGSAKVIASGTILYAVGILMMAIATTPLMLSLSVGLLAGLGLSGASITIVIAAVAKKVPKEKRSLSLGLVTAAGSLGQFSVVPVCQSILTEFGWQIASIFLAGLILLVLFFAVGFRSDRDSIVHQPKKVEIKNVIKIAFRSKSYLLLMTGFFVCGFHVSFITNHFPAYLTDSGINPQNAAWAVSLIGLFNIIGAYASGVMGGRFSKRNLLCSLYSFRALIICLFLVLPITNLSIVIFSISMGLLWLSTVPLTSGLVGVMFGTRHLGSLYGFVFLSHQLGAFSGVFLGAKIYDMTGGYHLVWVIAIFLSIIAALLHLPIEEKFSPKMKPYAVTS